MRNTKLTIAYDGRAYFGWQKTQTGPSIEETLQKALETVLQHPISLQAASRTDAGVHAHGQVVNFFTSYCISGLRHRLNRLLPKDISILSIDEIDVSFHPTLDCTAKEYHYWICIGKTQLPHVRNYSWHCPYSLNLNEMRTAIDHLIGKKDFSALCNVRKNAHYDDYTREIIRISIVECDSDRLRIEVVGNHFLYKMVRNIVGTLIYVGRGRIASSDLPTLLDAHDRTLLGITAPAHGLFLHRVYYQNP